jgi:hypothetical protein
MRTPTVILLLGTCFFVGIDCYPQESCSAYFSSVKMEVVAEPFKSAAELAHRALLTTPQEMRRHLVPGDVELILKCGWPQDAADLFAALRNTPIHLVDATIAEADQRVIRVRWDGATKFDMSLTTYRFNFDPPLTAIPHPGEKIIIDGTYSAYSHEPFQINITNASIHPVPPKPIVRPKQ